MGRFFEEKIIRTENEAVHPSSFYVIPIDENTFRLIITDDNGIKKISNVLTGNSEFIHLNDAPVTYTDNAGKAVIVNDSETGLIFTDIPPGQDATIEVGDVESLPADQPPVIENVGTPTNAIFNFKIPKGDTGTFTLEYNDIFDI